VKPKCFAGFFCAPREGRLPQGGQLMADFVTYCLH
jgi:hypothetical protein